MREDEVRFTIPSPKVPIEEEIVKPFVVQTALLYKLLQAIREVADKVEKVETAVLPLRTIVSRQMDVLIPAALIDLVGRGCLKTFMVKSDRSDFRLQVKLDGMLIYDYSFDQFKELSEQVDEVAAVEEDGLFVLNLTDLKFIESLKIAAEPTLPGKFKLREVYYSMDLAQRI
jgi:hypothetical protein